MRFSLSDQTAYFLWSLALGGVLAAAYDLLRAARMLLKSGKTAVLITDVLFFTVCGVVTSLFALPFNQGSVRSFIIFGEAVGFLCYRLTIGSIMGKVYAFIAGFLRKIIQKLHKIIEKTFDLLLKMTHVLVYNISVIIESLLKKASARRSPKAKGRRRSQRKDRKNGKKKRKKTRTKGGDVQERAQ